MKSEIKKGTITSIRPYGVFIKFDREIGLIHISAIEDVFISNINDYFIIGDQISFTIIGKDENYYKLKYYNQMIIDEHVKKITNLKRGFIPLENNINHWIKKELEK